MMGNTIEEEGCLQCRVPPESSGQEVAVTRYVEMRHGLGGDFLRQRSSGSIAARY